MITTGQSKFELLKGLQSQHELIAIHSHPFEHYTFAAIN
jgi:hypothetical protein